MTLALAQGNALSPDERKQLEGERYRFRVTLKDWTPVNRYVKAFKPIDAWIELFHMLEQEGIEARRVEICDPTKPPRFE